MRARTRSGRRRHALAAELPALTTRGRWCGHQRCRATSKTTETSTSPTNGPATRGPEPKRNRKQPAPPLDRPHSFRHAVTAAPRIMESMRGRQRAKDAEASRRSRSNRVRRLEVIGSLILAGVVAEIVCKALPWPVSVVALPIGFMVFALVVGCGGLGRSRVTASTVAGTAKPTARYGASSWCAWSATPRSRDYVERRTKAGPQEARDHQRAPALRRPPARARDVSIPPAGSSEPALVRGDFGMRPWPISLD
jgi:hypothetical protein